MVTRRKRQPPAQQSKKNGNPSSTPGQGITRYIGKGETSDIQQHLPTPPLTIEREVANDNGMIWVERCEITQEDVRMAQQKIKHAADKDENIQGQAIINAIKRLYSYEPYDGQRECLHYLIYQRTDLVLIAKTSFGKSMMLQAVSVLIGKSITLVIRNLLFMKEYPKPATGS